MFVLGLVCAVFNLDKEKLIGIVSRQFGKKDESVLRNAMLAFDAGFAYEVGDLERFAFEHGEAGDGHRISTDGNQMLTAGSSPPGCDTARPIPSPPGRPSWNLFAQSCPSTVASMCRPRMSSRL
ncbi:hypothetical protein [Verrucomicrobium spinosum]|uniref:hypothetical protein n=1 Tax=Verrucomicrobium spinosum TaxID=2736 RepID=UPI003CCCBF62